MIKLIAQPHNETFQVFEVVAVSKKHKQVHGLPGTFLGIVTREEVVRLFDEAESLNALFDGEHEDLVRRFIRAKNSKQTLFMEAIESVK